MQKISKTTAIFVKIGNYQIYLIKGVIKVQPKGFFPAILKINKIKPITIRPIVKA
tara:strand:+ start:439 stop:603 length:165 start_codon:yes stop_codon:yes gene_type:complete